MVEKFFEACKCLQRLSTQVLGTGLLAEDKVLQSVRHVFCAVESLL